MPNENRMTDEPRASRVQHSALSTRHSAFASASLITPPGEGGIGVIRVIGPGAVALVQAMFRGKRPADLAKGTGRLHYGHLLHAAEVLDEVLVAVIDSSAESQAVEINCHGGIAAVERILAELAARGAQRMPAESLADDRLDAIQQEAASLIPRAQSKVAVKMLLAQHAGGLSRRIREIAEMQPAEAAGALRHLCGTARLGLALCSPRRIVIAGSPNTGKSTLFNALIGQARAIVTDIPGTTRDYLTETVVLGGVPFELVDTAGLRDTDHIVEVEGINYARQQISAANLVLLVLDASRPITADERQMLADVEAVRRQGCPAVLYVLNKVDLLGAEQPSMGVEPAICVSALIGTGLECLETRIVETTVGAVSYDGGPMVFTARQLAAIEAALAAVEQGDPRSCRNELLPLLAKHT